MSCDSVMLLLLLQPLMPLLALGPNGQKQQVKHQAFCVIRTAVYGSTSPVRGKSKSVQ